MPNGTEGPDALGPCALWSAASVTHGEQAAGTVVFVSQTASDLEVRGGKLIREGSRDEAAC